MASRQADFVHIHFVSRHKRIPGAELFSSKPDINGCYSPQSGPRDRPRRRLRPRMCGTLSSIMKHIALNCVRRSGGIGIVDGDKGREGEGFTEV